MTPFEAIFWMVFEASWSKVFALSFSFFSTATRTFFTTVFKRDFKETFLSCRFRLWPSLLIWLLCLPLGSFRFFATASAMVKSSLIKGLKQVLLVTNIGKVVKLRFESNYLGFLPSAYLSPFREIKPSSLLPRFKSWASTRLIKISSLKVCLCPQIHWFLERFIRKNRPPSSKINSLFFSMNRLLNCTVCSQDLLEIFLRLLHLLDPK